MITFNIECNRCLYGPLVSTNSTHVHSIITDCRILDRKSSFDDWISSCGERSFFFGPRHCRVNVFSGKHLNMADWSRAMVLTAGVTTIPGAGITFPGSPLNGCREVWVGEVGSPGSPFSPFIPGGPGRPGYPGGPCGPCGPIFPGGPCTQIWLLLVQIFLVAVLTDWVICCCISGDKASLSPLEDSTSRIFLCRADSAIEERISVRED